MNDEEKRQFILRDLHAAEQAETSLSRYFDKLRETTDPKDKALVKKMFTELSAHCAKQTIKNLERSNNNDAVPAWLPSMICQFGAECAAAFEDDAEMKSVTEKQHAFFTGLKPKSFEEELDLRDAVIILREAALSTLDGMQQPESLGNWCIVFGADRFLILMAESRLKESQ